ncbi:hypothetical protein ACVWZ6_002269 [Bradyrhizobium sp. GM6.1]
MRDALRRHHPTARRLVLIASDDLIAAHLNRNGLKTGNGNRVPRARHINALELPCPRV